MSNLGNLISKAECLGLQIKDLKMQFDDLLKQINKLQEQERNKNQHKLFEND